MTDREILKYIDYAIEKAVSEFKKSGVLKNNDDLIYSDVSYMLNAYYHNGQVIPKIEQALESVSSDNYFRIIPEYYKDGKTIEKIAERMGVDVSTITRNKKRLCLEIYIALI